MNTSFGRHSTVWILFIWSLYLSPSNFCIGQLQDVYEKECQGTTRGFGSTGSNQVERYSAFKEMYQNCTFVRENLEISRFRLTGAKYDFHFLSTIREVNGYVLIFGNHVEKIRLNRLRVIRGWKTYSQDLNGIQRNFSLFVGWNRSPENESIGLRELQLTSLVEITKGDVLFRGNPHLCLGEETIDWKSMTKNNPNGEFFIIPAVKPVECKATCHKNCTTGNGRFCWAERQDKAMCQAERPCGTCRKNCSKREPNCKCHTECIGGCRPTGSNASSCVACKNFLRGDECVGNCSASKYNPDTSKMEDPPTTYMFENRCVPECPESMVIQDGACVIACATGYKENKTNNARKCIPCLEDCPKTCSGTGNTWLHGNNLAQFNHCTIVDGELLIVNSSFTGDLIEPRIKVSDLEILKDVEEVTGQISIQASDLDFSSLSFLGNLRTIGGNGHLPWSLYILETSLKALNLKSLTQIKTGGVYMTKNAALCYAHTVNWTRILTSKKTKQRVFIKENANSTNCEKNDLICSEKCTNLGCWGPGVDNCVSSLK